MFHCGRTFPRMQYFVHFVVLELYDCYTAINTICICKTGHIPTMNLKGNSSSNLNFHSLHYESEAQWLPYDAFRVWEHDWKAVGGVQWLPLPAGHGMVQQRDRLHPSHEWRVSIARMNFNHLIITVKQFWSKNGGWFSGFLLLCWFWYVS